MKIVYISVLFMGIGVSLLGYGIFLFFQQRARLARALSVEGIVVELLRQHARGNVMVKTAQGVKIEKKYLYRPVVRFETRAGHTEEFTAGIAQRPAPYQVGDRVPVLYDPNHPQQAQINRFVYLWFSVIILLFFGLFALGMGLLGVMMLNL